MLYLEHGDCRLHDFGIGVARRRSTLPRGSPEGNQDDRTGKSDYGKQTDSSLRSAAVLTDYSHWVPSLPATCKWIAVSPGAHHG